MCLNIMQPMYAEELTADILTNGEKLKAYPLRSRTRKEGQPQSVVFNSALHL